MLKPVSLGDSSPHLWVPGGLHVGMEAKTFLLTTLQRDHT